MEKYKIKKFLFIIKEINWVIIDFTYERKFPVKIKIRDEKKITKNFTGQFSRGHFSSNRSHLLNKSFGKQNFKGK